MKYRLYLILLLITLLFSGCAPSFDVTNPCPKQKYPKLTILRENYKSIPVANITTPIQLKDGRVSVLASELINASHTSMERKTRNFILEKHNKFYVKQILEYNKNFVNKDKK